MGIKFLCPNGHKLHVKSFLSGKKAICPKCAARVVVPGDSIEPDSSGAILGSDLDDSDIAGLGGFASNAAGDRSASIATASAPSTDADLLPASSRAVATESATAASDPIDEAPSAVWYVRPATGGQFGPASGEIMRAWIGEGRVGASSLVWRAGWPEWRAASAIFPQLGTMLASPGVSTGPPQRLATCDAETIVNDSNGASTLPRRLPTGQVVLSVAPEIPSAASSPSPAIPALTAGLRKKKRNKDVSLIASAILLVISIILVVILVMIWSSQGSPGPAPEDESETASEAMAQ